MKFLITGAGGPAGTNVIYYFPVTESVVACDSDPKALDRLKVVGKEPPFHTVPLAKDPAYLKALEKLIKTEKPDYIIPTVDEELSVLANSKTSFHNSMIISSGETIRTCLDKKLLYDFFSKEKFCPKYVCTDSRNDIKSSLGRGNVFMKPRVGRGSRGVMQYQTVDSIPGNKISQDNVFCEFLPGQEYTVDVMCDMKGYPIVIVPRKRLQTSQGISTVGQTEKREDIELAIMRICGRMDIKGPANIQFKLDSKGSPKLIEINPRFSGGLPITAASGVNMVQVLIDLLHGRKPDVEWREVKAENEIAMKIGRAYKQP